MNIEVDCEQSLFSLKIRGGKVAEHESRASDEAASSERGGRGAKRAFRSSPAARASRGFAARVWLVLGYFFFADFRAKESLLAVYFYIHRRLDFA